MCPRRLAEAAGAGTAAGTGGTGALTLTKCCLLEEEKFERTGDYAVVPWGASLTLIRAALADLVTSGEVAWSRD
jgi:hypothetical protein